ncbi:hypothetical protein BGW38_004260 [Lunasporangiospora selenospora]|uniref:3'-5' exonuclease n=1 Tax=Lunasporangiospora selenospora TaxID=979761 RepID=A0A9P6FQ17_9FUNG|nr:hypothetical protein BGW38_004260 [Lunasporangiospora selenospora]
MKGIPSALLRLLQDESILKVGVNIRNDGTKLFKDWGIHSAGLVELGALCIQVLDDLPSQRKVRSMESLTNDLLGHSVEKVELTRMGNWENFNLSSSQIAYAANDAFVTYEVAARIKELQASRPPQQYTLPLLSIQPEGGFVREVHQTLEEYQNNTGARDNRGLAKKAALAAGISDKSGTTTTLSSSRQSKRVVIKPASGTGAFYTNKKETPVTSKSTTTKELPSPSVTLKPAPGWTSKSDDGRLPLEVDKAFFYNNLIRRDGSIPFGGQSTVTIISKKDSKGRSFSTSTRDTFSDWSRDGLFVEENEDVSDTEKDLAESTFCVQPQDLTIPAMFSVPSLEDKSVLERNQVFWEETVGSMAKEEEEEGDSCDKKSGKDGDDEALLRNQSLFASISNSHI